MGFIGSDVREVTYNHPVLGGGKLSCKANESSKIDLGGLRNADDKAMITGDGKKITQKTMSRSVFELPPVAWDKTSADELAKLTALAASPIGATWTVSYVDDSIYQMNNGEIVGDIAGDGDKGTIPLILQGDSGALKIS